MVKYLLKGSLFIVTLAQNMKSPVLGLAFLFSAMSWVHCQTAPYVSFLGTNLPNHSYVDMGLVGYNHNGSDSGSRSTSGDTGEGELRDLSIELRVQSEAHTIRY